MYTGAFLLPYGVMAVLVGMPLFMLEGAIGQFASRGPTCVYSICPLLKGAGLATLVACWMVALYYNVLIAECLFFLGASFSFPKLPWAYCGPWASSNCVDPTYAGADNMSLPDNATASPPKPPPASPKSPSEEFYE